MRVKRGRPTAARHKVRSALTHAEKALLCLVEAYELGNRSGVWVTPGIESARCYLELAVEEIALILVCTPEGKPGPKPKRREE